MGKESPSEFRVTWTGHALDVLVDLIQGTRHATNNPAWVDRKYEEFVLEGIHRLELFPDLRIRYIIAGFKCGAMTLKALLLHVFYRQVDVKEMTIFDCRWASLDRSGPEDVGG